MGKCPKYPPGGPYTPSYTSIVYMQVRIRCMLNFIRGAISVKPQQGGYSTGGNLVLCC